MNLNVAYHLLQFWYSFDNFTSLDPNLLYPPLLGIPTRGVIPSGPTGELSAIHPISRLTPTSQSRLPSNHLIIHLEPPIVPMRSYTDPSLRSSGGTFVYRFICPCSRPSIHLIFPSRLSCLSAHTLIRPSVRQVVHLSTDSSVRLPVCPSILSFRLSRMSYRQFTLLFLSVFLCCFLFSFFFFFLFSCFV